MSDGCEYYSAESGIAALLSSPKARFCESVDVAIKLGVNDAVRGVAALPKGLGRDIKVAVFAKGEYAKQALDAGADLVGDDDLLGEIKEGRKLDVDWCISTPDFMTQVSSVAKILGPKGLLPNPKFGTVTFDVARMVGVIKSGQVRIKSDRYGIVHAKIGNVGFSAEDLLENFRAVLAAVQSLKPESTKGSYLKSVFMNTTMGKSFRISVAG